jgi:hypothetical protein
MKLYEALKLQEKFSIDTCDTVYDCIVTVDKFDEETNENYDLFCIELQKKVDFVEFFNGFFASAVVDWTGFIKKNKSVFEKYVKENWIENKQYVLENEEEFYCEWIEQIHLLCCGYGTDTTYKNFIKLLKTCK